MPNRNVDLIAIALLLLAFAFFTQVSEAVHFELRRSPHRLHESPCWPGRRDPATAARANAAFYARLGNLDADNLV